MRYSLKELMVSEETNLSKFTERVQTQNEFSCSPNDFIVFNDQRTVLGNRKEEMAFGPLSSKGMTLHL